MGKSKIEQSEVDDGEIGDKKHFDLGHSLFILTLGTSRELCMG